MRRIKQIYIVLFLACFLTLSLGDQILAALPEFPDAEGVYIFEENTGTVIYEQNENQVYMPASITKLMTALVLTDTITDLNQTVTVGNEVNDFDWEDSRAMIWEGQQLTYRDLLYAMLVPSGNDAAQSIAVNVGKVLSGSEDRATAEQAFYQAMNDKAAELGLIQTHFTNPHGRAAEGHYTTPEDFAKITQAAFKNGDIRQAASTKRYVLKNQDGSDNILYSSDYCLYSDSKDMEGYPGIGAIFPGLAAGTVAPNLYYSQFVSAAKTGRTDAGTRTYAFYSDQGDSDIYGVIMDTDDYGIFSQTKAALDTIVPNYSKYDLEQITDSANPIEIENVSILSPKELNFELAENAIFDDSSNFSNLNPIYRFDPELISVENGVYTLNKTVEEGDKIGAVLVNNSNNITQTIPVYASDTYQVKNFLDLIVDNIVWVVLGIVMLGVIIWLIARFWRKKKERKSGYYGRL